MAKREVKHQVYDQFGLLVNGSKLHQLYLSIIFTRTPSVPLPAQRLAFLMVTFVRITEQLLRSKMLLKKDFCSDGKAQTLVRFGIQCVFTIRQLVRGVGIACLVKRLELGIFVPK